MSRPLIGMALDRRLTSYEGWPDEPTDALFTHYVDLIEEAGGVALLLASMDVTVEAVEHIIDIVDGVLIAGGRDIAPRFHGQAPHPANDTPLVAVAALLRERKSEYLTPRRGDPPVDRRHPPREPRSTPCYRRAAPRHSAVTPPMTIEKTTR